MPQVHCQLSAAGFGSGFFDAAVGAELAGDAALAAGTHPALLRRSGGGLLRLLLSLHLSLLLGLHLSLLLGLHLGLLHLLLLSHLEEVLGVHAAGLTGHAHAHESHGGTGARVGGCRLHRLTLRADKVRRCTGGIHKGRVALQLLDHLLVFLVGLHAGNAEGNDLHTAQVAPLAGQAAR